MIAPAADSRVTLEEVQRNHEQQLKDKDAVIEQLKLKMNDMAEEFAEMLQVRGCTFACPFCGPCTVYATALSTGLLSPFKPSLMLSSPPLACHRKP